MFTLSTRSLASLAGVHPDLQRLVRRTGELCDAKGLDFIVTDGCRSLEQQKAFVAAGKSQTMHSRHLGGFAIDFVARIQGRVTYDVTAMTEISELFKEAANELQIPIEWGGDWHSFKDTPHIQLAKKQYPDYDDTNGR
jgi:peptidoglycan LD-endopeptidase CwlK